MQSGKDLLSSHICFLLISKYKNVSRICENKLTLLFSPLVLLKVILGCLNHVYGLSNAILGTI